MTRFFPGDPVRILDREHRGHMRTPRYLRGHRGIVERHCGAFPNPEKLAYDRPAERRDLYRVRLRQRDLWPGYEGGPADTLEVEIYDHWLEPGHGA